MTPEAWLVLKVLGAWTAVSVLGCALRWWVLRHAPRDDRETPMEWPKTLKM